MLALGYVRLGKQFLFVFTNCIHNGRHKMCAHTLISAKLTCDKKCNIHIYNPLKFLQKTQITAMLTRHIGDMYILFEIVAEDNFYSYFCKVMAG